MYRVQKDGITMGFLNIQDVCVYANTDIKVDLPFLVFNNGTTTLESTLKFLKWILHKEDTTDAEIVIEALLIELPIEREGISLAEKKQNNI